VASALEDNTALVIWFGVFTLLHGLTHFWYAGHSAGRYELKPGMTWPDRSWALSRVLGDRATRKLATYSLVLAGVGFVIAGAGILAHGAGWWPPVALGAAALSAVLFCLCWDGRRSNLDGQGLIGIIIDIAILAAALSLW
jgi:hypothetical protein